MFQVHIQPIAAPILGHTDQQKPLVVVPSTDVAAQKTGVDTQVLKLSCLRFTTISCTFSE
jgi:hypothetical protein